MYPYDGDANLGSITNSNYYDEWPPPKVDGLNYKSLTRLTPGGGGDYKQ